jgi:ABC-type enterochelin transport system ATPase subunit
MNSSYQRDFVYYSINKKEEMDFEKRERIESLLSFNKTPKLTVIINDIADQMLEDGFEYSDVKEFINEYLDEILGGIEDIK